MFNSDDYAWVDFKINLLGRSVVGFQGLKYKRTKEKEFVYARGSKPYGIQSGNEAVTGVLKLLQPEYNLLVKAIKAAKASDNVTDISLDIVATYGDGITATTDVIKSVEFKDYEKGMEQNDKFMLIELPFMALDLLEGV